MKGKNSGTREWAVKTVNCCTGCSHDCRYCYAKEMAIRFKQVTAAQWPLERIRDKDVFKSHTKYSGRVMFPSSHDITELNLSACTIVLNNLLEAGNEVLVVSKPHFLCIGSMCTIFKDYRDKLTFRFSISACDDRILSFWEPNAPACNEREEALQYAYQNGFQTSVSIEPMLDSANIDNLINQLSPYVTDSIWIGKMNHLGRFGKNANPVLQQEIEKIHSGQTDDIINSIYQRYRDNSKIKWKAEIKKIVGIPLAGKPGMDI
jgi:DNA repair photolyase